MRGGIVSRFGHWQYDSGAVIALGGVLRTATGKAADEFARTEFFDKIGAQNTAWYKGAPNGLPHMGGANWEPWGAWGSE